MTKIAHARAEIVFFTCFEDKSGNFLGHLIPASLFLLFGASYCILILCRVRRINNKNKKNHHKKIIRRREDAYCEIHVPENNPTLLRVGGSVIVCLTAVGILIEAISGCIMITTTNCLIFNLGHQALYVAYGSVGLVALLESQNYLQSDSWRAALALTSLSCYFLWYEHAEAKVDDASHSLHLNIARVCLIQTLAIVVSMYFYKSSLLLYVWGVGGCFILYALTLITAGIHCFARIPREIVGPIFALQIVAVQVVIVLSTACCCGHHRHDNFSSRIHSSSSSGSTGSTGTNDSELQALKQENHDDYKHGLQLTVMSLDNSGKGDENDNMSL